MTHETKAAPSKRRAHARRQLRLALAARPNLKGSIGRTRRKDSVLHNLSDDQTARLGYWLSKLPIHKVLKKLRAPAPDGFGLHLKRTTLVRYYRHLLKISSPAWQEAAQLVEASQPSKLAKDPAALCAAVRLQQRVYELSLNLRQDPELLFFLWNEIHRQQEAQLKLQIAQFKCMRTPGSHT
jgi:hypothetical protein